MERLDKLETSLTQLQRRQRAEDDGPFYDDEDEDDWEDDEEDETEYGPDSVVSSKLCPPPVHPNTTLPQWIQQFQNCVVSPEKLTQMIDGVYALAKGRMMYELLLDELDKLNCYIDESGQVQLILPPPTE